MINQSVINQFTINTTGSVVGLRAVESNTDTLNALGNVLVKGSLIALDEVDSFASTGDVFISGALSVTDAVDLAVIAGQVLIQGSLAVQETEVDRFLTTSTGTRVGSMHHKETKGDSLAISGDVLESSVVRHLYYKVSYSTDFNQNFTQLIYIKESTPPNYPSELVTLPEDTLAEGETPPILPPNPTDEDIILSVKGETLLKWYKSSIDLAGAGFHPYDSVSIGQTTPGGYIPEPGADVDLSTIVGLTESTRDTFSATGLLVNTSVPVIIEVRDYKTDTIITTVAVTLAVDGVSKTVTNGVAYVGALTSGTHSVLASATGYQSTDADSIANDSFTL